MAINDQEKARLSNVIYKKPDFNKVNANYKVPEGFEFLEASGGKDSKGSFCSSFK